MIRFIDIRQQGTGARFSFWDTITDSYFKFNNNQAWESYQEFETDIKPHAPHKGQLDRFKSLCPKWVNDGKEDPCVHNETKIGLLVKQCEEITNRFDVAMKALELLTTPPINYSNTKHVASSAIEEIEQMIKDYDNKNEFNK